MQGQHSGNAQRCAVDHTQVLAIAAVIRHPAILTPHLIGRGAGLIFTDIECQTIADSLCFETEPELGYAPEWLIVEISESIGMFGSSYGPAWGMALIDRLACENACEVLAATFQWASESLRHRTRGVSDVLREIQPVVIAARRDA